MRAARSGGRGRETRPRVKKRSPDMHAGRNNHTPSHAMLSLNSSLVSDRTCSVGHTHYRTSSGNAVDAISEQEKSAPFEARFIVIILLDRRVE